MLCEGGEGKGLGSVTSSFTPSSNFPPQMQMQDIQTAYKVWPRQAFSSHCSIHTPSRSPQVQVQVIQTA